MGINVDIARFLLAAYNADTKFSRVLTLGRLDMRMPHWLIKKIQAETGRALPFPLGDEAWGFAEPFLEMLGAQEIVALDAVHLDGAQIAHDLNLPIGDDLKEQFDVVIDGGTLEHIFNFPIAIKNSMEMLKPGGSVFYFTPANNFCGHGFYQFSPELFYRVLSEENGFELVRIVACEAYSLGRWFDVCDPALLSRRVPLVNAHRVMLFVHGRRTEVRQVLASSPQQREYENLWKDKKKQTASLARRRKLKQGGLKEVIQRFGEVYCPRVARFLRASSDRYHTYRRCSLTRQPKGFKRIKPD